MTIRPTTATALAVLAPILLWVTADVVASFGGPAPHAAAEHGGTSERNGMLDPAAWGGDHVGSPRPEFVSGDECLFCHRRDIGTTWTTNRHRSTVRPADGTSAPLQALAASAGTDVAGEVEYVLGRNRRVRFLKSSNEYGRLELLTVSYLPPANARRGEMTNAGDLRWDSETFGNSCAGCHATSVDRETRSFAAVSLDCSVCHGDVPLEHSKEPSLVHLSRQRGDHPRVVISICAQCHIRSGRSRSTGAPYPDNFVAGDNVFRDFQVDWSVSHLAALDPGYRHVLENVRDVVIEGQHDMSCLSCHDIHRQKATKHRQLPRGRICSNCHSEKDFSATKEFSGRNSLCGY